MLSLDLEIYSDRYKLELKYAAECQEWLEEEERREASYELESPIPAARVGL